MIKGIKRRIQRVRAKINGTAERPRLSVFRSNKHIYGQLIDDVAGLTLAAAADSELKEHKSPVENAEMVGKLLAEKAKAKKITKAVYDRHGLQYHGQVESFAKGARDGGLEF